MIDSSIYHLRILSGQILSGETHFFSCLLLWTLLMRTEFLASQKMTTAKEAFFKQSNGWVSKSNGDIETCQQFYHKNVFINFSGHEPFFFYLPKTIKRGYLCGTLSNIRNGTNSNGKNLCENRSNLVEKKITNFLRYSTEVFYQMLLQTDAIRMSTRFQAIGEQTLWCLYCIRTHSVTQTSRLRCLYCAVQLIHISL